MSTALLILRFWLCDEVSRDGLHWRGFHPADDRRYVAHSIPDNGYTNSATVQDCVLLKAAETAQATGGSHFQIISAADASRSSTIVFPGDEHNNCAGESSLHFTIAG